MVNTPIITNSYMQLLNNNTLTVPIIIIICGNKHKTIIIIITMTSNSHEREDGVSGYVSLNPDSDEQTVASGDTHNQGTCSCMSYHCIIIYYIMYFY